MTHLDPQNDPLINSLELPVDHIDLGEIEPNPENGPGRTDTFDDWMSSGVLAVFALLLASGMMWCIVQIWQDIILSTS